MTAPSTAVVEAVAAEKGVPPEELDCVLADAVDPAALDALVESLHRDDADGLVRFSYCGFVVEVWSDGTVTL